MEHQKRVMTPSIESSSPPANPPQKIKSANKKNISSSSSSSSSSRNRKSPQTSVKVVKTSNVGKKPKRVDIQRLLVAVREVTDTPFTELDKDYLSQLVVEVCTAYCELSSKDDDEEEEVVVEAEDGGTRSDDDDGQDEEEEEQERQQQEDKNVQWQRQCVENAMRILYYLEKAVSASSIAANLIAAGLGATDTASAVSPEDHAAGLAAFCKMDLLDQKMNRFQQLLLYLLNCLHHEGYRRCGSDCYKQLYTSDGHNTRAWVPACSIKNFVYAMTRKETKFDQWLNLTECKNGVGSAAEYLSSCVDVQFPELVKKRSVFSFRNGVYDAKRDYFYPYTEGGVPSDYVACKYFDLDFDSETGSAGAGAGGDCWGAIPTPHFQSILDYQGFEDDVSRWMYVMIGRLMYEVNEMDRWQVIPYLKGQACSGKSTILLRVCRNLYDKADVGVLSNNIEKKFGLGAFSDKYLFVAPEIKSDLQMEQAEFQSMVSGEDMSICVKYQMAQTTEWRVPGIMAGNEVPGWVDNSGSITRRIVLFDFAKKVENSDMELGKKLESEMAMLIKKCNRAYHWAVRNYARDNIWKHLPSYFHATRDELAETTNALVSFLNSNSIKYGPDLYMPWNDFLSSFQNHVRMTNMKLAANFTKDYYAAAFLRFKLRKSPRSSRTYRGGFYTKIWLEGGELIEGADNGDDDAS
jgi:hypothetical protein